MRISYTNALGDSVDPGEALVFTTQRSAPILWDIQPPSGYQSGNELVLIMGDQLGANMTWRSRSAGRTARSGRGPTRRSSA